jgi:hypothetical protein
VRSSSFLLYPPAKWRVIFCLTVALDRCAGDRHVARDHRGGDLDCLLTGSQFQRQHLMNNLQETLRPIYLTSRPMENTRRCNRPGLNEPCSKCPGMVQTTLAPPPWSHAAGFLLPEGRLAIKEKKGPPHQVGTPFEFMLIGCRTLLQPHNVDRGSTRQTKLEQLCQRRTACQRQNV